LLTTCPAKKPLKKTRIISRDRLLELLSYDAEAGIFTRRVQAGSRGKIGSRAGTLDAESGYRIIGIDGVHHFEHRLAWLYVYGWMPPEVDHRDLDRSNNKILNLRPSTRPQNCANTRARSNNKSGIKGVSFHRRAGRYFARLVKDGRAISLGYYDTAELAGAAYAAAADREFGEFART
jgi:hypothetical protein